MVRALLAPDGRRDPYPLYARLHRLGAAGPLDPALGYDVVVAGYAAADRVLRDTTFRMLDARVPVPVPVPVPGARARARGS